MIESPLAETIVGRNASAWIKSYVKMVALGSGSSVRVALLPAWER